MALSGRMECPNNILVTTLAWLTSSRFKLTSIIFAIDEKILKHHTIENGYWLDQVMKHHTNRNV